MLPHQIAMVRSDSRAAWDAHDAEAADRLEAVLPELREHGSPEDLAAACLGVALVRWRTGRKAEAAQRFIDFALGAFRFEDAPRPWMRLLNFSLFLNLERGEWVDALPLAMLIRRRAASLPDATDEWAQATANMGWTLWQLGDLDGARRLLEEGATVAGQSSQGGQCVGDLIALLIEMGKIDEAVRYNQTLAASPLVSPRREEVLGLANARVLHAQGRFDDALPVALSTLATTEGLYEERASLRAIAAECLLQTGRPRGALEHAQRGLDVLRLHPEAREHMVLLTLQGRAAHALGDHDLILTSLAEIGRLEEARRRRALGAGLSRVLQSLDEEGTALTDVEVEAQAQSLQRSNLELREARRRVEEAEAEKADLAQQVERLTPLSAASAASVDLAGDLGRLLDTASGALTALRQTAPEPPAALARLDLSVGQAGALVRRLHRVHVPTAARPAPIAIAEHLSRSVEVARRVLTTRILIEMGGSAGGRVQLAPMELEQLVLNLALYAHDAVPGAAAIRMTAETQTGPRAARLRLKVQAQRGQQTAGPAEAGRAAPDREGLPLVVCRAIVASAGGRMWLSEGAGPTLMLELPAVDVAPQPALEPTAAAAERRPTILLVEDEPMVRAAVKRQLRRSGCDIIVAEDGRAGLDAWQTNRDHIRLLLTDVVMPRMSGAELARVVLDDQPELPVIIMSGYTARSNVSALLRSDNVRFLSKPFGPRELSSLMDELNTAYG